MHPATANKLGFDLYLHMEMSPFKRGQDQYMKEKKGHEMERTQSLWTSESY